jgi:hypothetical protein
LDLYQGALSVLTSEHKSRFHGQAEYKWPPMAQPQAHSGGITLDPVYLSRSSGFAATRDSLVERLFNQGALVRFVPDD